MIEPRRARGRDKPQGPVGLRRDAEKVAGALPPLLAEAEQLAAIGRHGLPRPPPCRPRRELLAVPPGACPAIRARPSTGAARASPTSSSSARWSGRRRRRSTSGSTTRNPWTTATPSTSGPAPRTSVPRSSPSPSRSCSIKAGERVALMGTDAAQPRAGRAQLNRMALALGTERGDGDRARLRRPAGRPAGPRRPGGLLLRLPRRPRHLRAGLRPCRRPGGARLPRAGARRDRGDLPLRRPDDLPVDGRTHRVRDPARARPAGGLRRPPRERRASSSTLPATSAGAPTSTTRRRRRERRCSGSTWPSASAA